MSDFTLLDDFNITDDDISELSNSQQIDVITYLARHDVERAINQSGLSKAVWVATSQDAAEMLGEWEAFKHAIKQELSIEVPDLIEGCEVKLI